MLEPLKSLFSQIFIITHIDELQSEIRHKINVIGGENGPKIVY
jgi:hypothetical protein